jgi:hypothetical protein
MAKLKQVLLLTCAAGLFYLTALYLMKSNSFVQQHHSSWYYHKTTSTSLSSSLDSALVPKDQHRVMLATHNRLAWYYPITDTMHVLHQGQVRDHISNCHPALLPLVMLYLKRSPG